MRFTTTPKPEKRILAVTFTVPVLPGEQQSFKEGGWGSLLAAHITPFYDIYCRGFSGYTTRSAISLLPRFFHTEFAHPTLVTIFWGANDSSSGKQHVPLGEFTANLKKIVEFFHDENRYPKKPKLVLITPPPVDSIARNSEDRVNEVTGEYAKAVVSVAVEYQLTYIDLFNGMLASENWQEYFNDGLHLNHSGNKFVWEELKKVIDALGPLEFDFPPWSALDFADPESTLKEVYDK